METIGYARVSTDEQEEALSAQVSRLIEAGCSHVIQELVSGGKNDRPGILELIDRIKRGRVAKLLITRVDRLGRDAQFTDTLLAMCAEQSVEVKALDGGVIEAASPSGFVMSRILTTMAEHERRMLSLRIKSQFKVYRKQGRALRRRMTFGYCYNDNHGLAPHPENWEKALHVLDLLREKVSFTQVSTTLAKEKSVWTPAPSSLQYWLVNPIIRGHLPHLYDRKSGKGWKATWAEINYDQHEALISEANWQELKIALQKRSRSFVNNPSAQIPGAVGAPKHGLTGSLSCMNCGHNLRRHTSATVAWWSCRHRNCFDRGKVKEHIALHWASEEAIKAAHKMAEAAAAPASINPALSLKLADLEATKALAERNPALLPAVELLEKEIVSIQSKPVSTPNVAVYLELIKQPGFFLGATPAEQRALLAGVLQTIRVDREGKHLAVPRMF